MNTSGLVKHLVGRCVSATGGLYQAMAAVGLLAVMFVFLQVGVGRLADLSAADPGPVAFGSIPYEPAEAAVPAQTFKYRALATYLSKRYRVAQDATEQLVGVAFDAGQQVGLDPLLILAVMAVESRLNPIAESETGAKGLMQVIPSYHKDKIRPNEGGQSMLDPMTNVLLGARILKDYIRRTGSLESGLQFYNGALSDTTSQYAQKVLALQERLRQTMGPKGPAGPKASPV